MQFPQVSYSHKHPTEPELIDTAFEKFNIFAAATAAGRNLTG